MQLEPRAAEALSTHGEPTEASAHINLYGVMRRVVVIEEVEGKARAFQGRLRGSFPEWSPKNGAFRELGASQGETCWVIWMAPWGARWLHPAIRIQMLFRPINLCPRGCA